MALKKRTRVLQEKGLSKAFATEIGVNLAIDKGNGNVTKTYRPWPRQLRGFQITESEGHPWFPKGSRPAGDIGGPFKTRKVEVREASHLNTVQYSPNTPFVIRDERNGYMIPSPVSAIVNATTGVFQSVNYPDLSSSDELLENLGTTAISLCNPVNPVFDASTFFAEIFREGLPAITGLSMLRSRNLSSVGDEFLNWQFGIKPILDGLQDLGKSLTTQDKVIKQLRRDSGRLVRRSFEFPTEREVTSDTAGVGSFQTSHSSQLFPNGFSGTTVKQTIVERRRWFSGAFTYHLPEQKEFEGIRRMVLEADKLYGLAVDTADLWNLIPWSWSVDWFVNIGPVISNLSNMAKYGLVMPYGYMMENTIVEYQYSFTPTGSTPGAKNGISLTIVDETKKRVKASPFGFGVTWEEFDTTQLAILGALGLSRSPF